MNTFGHSYNYVLTTFVRLRTLSVPSATFARKRRRTKRRRRRRRNEFSQEKQSHIHFIPLRKKNPAFWGFCSYLVVIPGLKNEESTRRE